MSKRDDIAVRRDGGVVEFLGQRWRVIYMGY